MASSPAMRAIPPVNAILSHPALQHVQDVPREAILAACRYVLENLRARLEIGEGIVPDPEAIALECAALARRMSRATPLRVINATGVVIHTNMGRAPLPKQAIYAMDQASEYCDLELDLSSGERGSRQSHVRDLLARVTGAEDAMVCNNNAGAVLLVLSALADKREVIVSRGELVEIGGSFRVPEIMEQSGAHLVEVGTTNRTRLSDYEKAFTDRTAMILKVHQSNYRIVGFTESVSAESLQSLARSRNVPLLYDCGSGLITDLEPYGLGDEPLVPRIVALGCDIVCFSGDKLLGGPQAGIIVGKSKHVSEVKRHPLARALRPDKTVLAALSATLRIYAFSRPLEEIPVLRMLTRPAAELETMAQALAAALREDLPAGTFTVIAGESCPGGGSYPGVWLKSYLVSAEVPGYSASTLAAMLRQASPPVIARLHESRLVMDVRTLDEGEFEGIAQSFRSLKIPC